MVLDAQDGMAGRLPGFDRSARSVHPVDFRSVAVFRDAQTHDRPARCSFGLHASACPRPATPLAAPGNSEAAATEQLDPARPAFSQSAAPPLQAAVVLDLALSAEQR